LTGGVYTNGRWVEGSPAEIVILASVQPAQLKDVSKIIELLPEGRRNSVIFQLYTNAKLNTTENTENPDKAVIDGKEFEVTMEATWQNNVINHYLYIVTRLKEV